MLQGAKGGSCSDACTWRHGSFLGTGSRLRVFVETLLETLENECVP